MNENEIGKIVLGAALKVHTALGPGLLESAYEICLAHEIVKNGLSIKQQVLLPVRYFATTGSSWMQVTDWICLCTTR